MLVQRDFILLCLANSCTWKCMISRFELLLCSYSFLFDCVRSGQPNEGHYWFLWWVYLSILYFTYDKHNISWLAWSKCSKLWNLFSKNCWKIWVKIRIKAKLKEENLWPKALFVCLSAKVSQKAQLTCWSNLFSSEWITLHHFPGNSHQMRDSLSYLLNHRYLNLSTSSCTFHPYLRKRNLVRYMVVQGDLLAPLAPAAASPRRHWIDRSRWSEDGTLRCHLWPHFL